MEEKRVRNLLSNHSTSSPWLQIVATWRKDGIGWQDRCKSDKKLILCRNTGHGCDNRPAVLSVHNPSTHLAIVGCGGFAESASDL